MPQLQGVQIYKKLNWLNELPVDEAEYVFHECCGSRAWARSMARARPFPMLESLYQRADEVWAELSSADRLEAIAVQNETDALERTQTDLMVATEKARKITVGRLGKLLER